MSIEIEPIGWIETCYEEKFGAPRQSGLVKEAWGKIKFAEALQHRDFIKGIEGFSHLWLIFHFHLAQGSEKRALVRPPRLGGNETLGVFATRAPYRPNPMGLSVVELVDVVTDGEKVLELVVKGVDLVNGTPLLDIKPYIPQVDAIPDARSGFVDSMPEKMTVHWQCEVPFDSETKTLIEASLAIDPRPAYHDDEREYGCAIAGWNVRWKVVCGEIYILKTYATY